jgi:folate-binding protein YgfZ
MTVLITEDEVLLLLESNATERLAAVFDKLIIMEDVQVRNVSAEFRVFGLLGKETGKALPESLGAPPAVDHLYDHQLVSKVRVVNHDLGYNIIVPVEEEEIFLKRSLVAGAIEINQETWNVVRTEAGLPVYGVDIDETTTMPELGQRGISYDKGCYIGQEVVARIKYIGHVNRRFVGFVCEGSAVPAARSAIQMNGKDAGYVTSAVYSPTLLRPIALGFVNRAASAPGTAVTLLGETEVHAMVSELPFF